MRNVTILLIGLVFFSSCKKEGSGKNDGPALREETYLNVSYGNEAAQKMDIYLPAGRTGATRVLFLIHGGGWTIGDKSEFTSYIPSVKQKLPGYAIVNINYRLNSGTANQFPAQENDVKSAVNFIYGKRGEYQLSDKFVLLGASAGGHLALLHAYKNNTPVKVKAVVSFFGPADMAALYNGQSAQYQSALQMVVGGTPTSNPGMYWQSSPINFVNAQSAPTILLHGGADFVVPPSQSVNLKNRLQADGVPHQYVFYPNEGHGWAGATMEDSFNKIAAFLKQHVN